LDGRCDIYSLGAVGYFLLTGWPLFRKATALQLLIAHVHEPVQLITTIRPEVPADLEGVVQKCLEKDRGRGYPNIPARKRIGEAPGFRVPLLPGSAII
jgi:serine/threonine-protein kinase